MLSETQLEHFREHGYVNAGRVFDADDIKVIAREYDRLVNFEAQTLGNDEDGKFPYRAMLSLRSPEIDAFVNHPRLMSLVAQLLGPDVRFWWDQGINKAPGSGSRIPWHQDNGYQHGRVPEYLTTWLALDDSDAANGGLFVIPGSHRDGQREHERMDVHWRIPDVDESGAIELPAKAGETLIFSTLLVHQTVGNHTRDRNRRAWVMQYADAHARNEVTGQDYGDRAWVLNKGKIVDKPWSERPFNIRGNANREK